VLEAVSRRGSCQQQGSRSALVHCQCLPMPDHPMGLGQPAQLQGGAEGNAGSQSRCSAVRDFPLPQAAPCLVHRSNAWGQFLCLHYSYSFHSSRPAVSVLSRLSIFCALRVFFPQVSPGAQNGRRYQHQDTMNI
jgi:hypothetical protein